MFFDNVLLPDVNIIDAINFFDDDDLNDFHDTLNSDRDE